MKIKVEIEISEDLDSIKFKSGKKTIEWNDLTKEQQKRIVNSFANFQSLFKRFIKE
jgi:hypothetical protein